MNKDQEKLKHFIEVEASVCCTKCGRGTFLEDVDPDEDAYEQGWRATDNHCYCPECAVKYLKKKNHPKNSSLKNKKS